MEEVTVDFPNWLEMKKGGLLDRKRANLVYEVERTWQTNLSEFVIFVTDECQLCHAVGTVIVLWH